jgi:hypothetical protein
MGSGGNRGFDAPVLGRRGNRAVGYWKNGRAWFSPAKKNARQTDGPDHSQ